MSGMSVGTGLVTGTDYTTMITQLMAIEAQPQTLLKNQLASAQSQASALRQINTNMAALASAAKAVQAATAWTAAKATSSSSAVTATAGAGAATGSLTFSVDKLAAAHSVVSAQNWTKSTDALGFGTPLTVTWADQSTKDITLSDTDGNGTISLAEAVTSINKAGVGLSAAAVSTGTGYRLQVTSSATGSAKSFSLSSAGMASNYFGVLTQGQNAQITVGPGSTNAYSVTAATNTFSDVLAGTTFTAGATASSATITVGADSSAAVSAVQGMVNAANQVLNTIGSLTDSSTGSKAALKGNWSVNSLAGNLLNAVSSAIGASSAGSLGLELTNSGTLQFDATAFQSKLDSDPALVQSVFSGATGNGADNVLGTADDSLVTDGIAARLQRLALQASDSVGGSITTLALGQDTHAKDLQDQIDAWGLRLTTRKDTLTAQFTALETALGTLQSQSQWLTGQINSLPSWNSSSK